MSAILSRALKLSVEPPKVRFDKITGLEFIMCRELTGFNSIFSLCVFAK